MSFDVSDYFDDLVQFEGCTTWLYCDTRGFVTIGIGNLVSSPDACAKLPLVGADESPASDEAKRAAWACVTDAFTSEKSAEFYRHLTVERLPLSEAQALVAQRLELEFIPGIRQLCHDFDAWPLPARKAIVDMAYNLGIGGLAKFHNLISACQNQDWAAAAHECHRSTSRDSRNAWTMTQFIDADVSQRKDP